MTKQPPNLVIIFVNRQVTEGHVNYYASFSESSLTYNSLLTMSYKDPMDSDEPSNGSESEGSELSMNEDYKSSSPVHGNHCFLFSFPHNSEFEKANEFTSKSKKKKLK